MSLDPELIKQLNLVNGSPRFVLRENQRTGKLELKNPPVVPDGDGIYWVAATCRLKNGMELPAVLRVDTDAGGSLQSVFWKIEGGWVEHSGSDTLKRLGLTSSEVFPFDWSFKVPLHRDSFHD